MWWLWWSSSYLPSLRTGLPLRMVVVVVVVVVVLSAVVVTSFPRILLLPLPFFHSLYLTPFLLSATSRPRHLGIPPVAPEVPLGNGGCFAVSR